MRVTLFIIHFERWDFEIVTIQLLGIPRWSLHPLSPELSAVGCQVSRCWKANRLGAGEGFHQKRGGRDDSFVGLHSDFTPHKGGYNMIHHDTPWYNWFKSHNYGQLMGTMMIKHWVTGFRVSLYSHFPAWHVLLPTGQSLVAWLVDLGCGLKITQALLKATEVMPVIPVMPDLLWLHHFCCEADCCPWRTMPLQKNHRPSRPSRPDLSAAFGLQPMGLTFEHGAYSIR